MQSQLDYNSTFNIFLIITEQFAVNAPKTSFFALILLVSFLLHSTLFVVGTLNHLNQTRVQNGQQLLVQLSEDSSIDLANSNRIALALLANRYITVPTVASIQIFTTDKQLLVSAGDQKTRISDTLTHNVKQNDQNIGYIELSLIQTGAGEVVSNIWWTLFCSLIIHIALFVLYYISSRPRRSIYAQQIVESQQTQAYISKLENDLSEKGEKLDHFETLYQESIQESKPNTAVIDDSTLALKIKFFDPEGLMPRVSPTISTPYFQMCQQLLESCIHLVCEKYYIESDEVKFAEKFNENGVTITLSTELKQATECILLINAVACEILKTIYTVYYQQNNRFALLPHSAVAMRINTLNLNAVETANTLIKYAAEQQTAIYLRSEQHYQISQQYQLTELPHPSDILTRNASFICGMSSEIATQVTHYRDTILSQS